VSTPTLVTLANANQYSQTGSVTAVSNFTSVTDVSPGGATLGQAYQTAPAQLYPGQMWRFTANGIWSSTGSPGLSLGVYYGGAAGSPICYGSVGAASTPANAASIPWQLHAVGRLTAVGATTAVWQVIGTLTGINSSGATTVMPQYTQAGQYDTSIAKIITVAATCSASAAANAVTVYNWAIEYLTEP
jgi:hypothetical protein